MQKVVEYFFTPISGYAYLGHDEFHSIAERTNASIRYCPVDIMRVFEASETTPPAKQSEARKTYRQEDMARLAKHHSLPLNLSPKYWPAPGGLASRAIIASGHLELDQSAVSGAIMKGVWALDTNIADAIDLQNLLDNEKLPGQTIIDSSAEKYVQEEFDKITQDAISQCVFGSPTFIFDNARYWGQDRLGLLENNLSGA